MRTRLKLVLLLPLLLCGCDSTAPIPTDTLSLSFGIKDYNAAFACTLKAAEATGFVVKAAEKNTGWIAGRMPAPDKGTDMFMGTFTVDAKTATINAKIEKLLNSNLGLLFDTKSEIDQLLNTFQANYSGC